MPDRRRAPTSSAARRRFESWVEDHYSPDVLESLQLFDGLDDAIVGLVSRFGMEPVVCYDVTRVIALLRAQGCESDDEALEHFDFNIAGAWIGDGTPAFVTLMPPATTQRRRRRARGTRRRDA